MAKILLDTNALIWLDTDDKKLGRQSRRMITHAQQGDLYASVLSFWELATITAKKRLHTQKQLPAWRIALLETGLQEIAVDNRVIMRALEILPYHTDPIDCLIMGTAMAHNMVLVTSDERILGWKGPLERQDAFK